MKLTSVDRVKLQLPLKMKGGYVLDFSTPSFADFVQGATGRNILDPKFGAASGSKANRLHTFWQLEDDRLVARLLAELIDYAIIRGIGTKTDALIGQCRRISACLLQAGEMPPTSTLNVRDITADNFVVGSQTIIYQSGPGQAQPPAPDPLPAADVRLLDLIAGHFSLEDLSVLAFELGIDADELAGDAKTAKALSLLRYYQRRGSLAQLKEAMRKARPHIAGLVP